MAVTRKTPIEMVPPMPKKESANAAHPSKNARPNNLGNIARKKGPACSGDRVLNNTGATTPA